MRFRNWTRILLLVWLAVVTVVGSVSAQDASARQLIQQLSHPDFRERIRAEKLLLGLGASVIPELESSVKNAGGELHYRGNRLLSALRQASLYENALEVLKVNPWRVGGEISLAWERFHELAGDSPASRALFIKMLQSDSALTLSVAGDAAARRMLLETRCNEVTEVLRLSQTAYISPGSVAAILFATLCMDHLGPRTAGVVSTLLNSGAYNRAVKAEREFLINLNSDRQGDGGPGDESGPSRTANPEFREPILQPVIKEVGRSGPLHSLIAHWIQRPLVSSKSRLDLAVRYQLAEGVVPALEMFEAGRGQEARAPIAVFFLAAYGGPDAVSRIETLLDRDFELHGTTQNTAAGQIKFSCQVRDVALLALVQCTGQDAGDYGFKDLRPSPTQFFELDRVGFTTDVERRQALQRWKLWRGKHHYDHLKLYSDASEGTLL